MPFCVHVGNLDWEIEAGECKRLILDALGSTDYLVNVQELRRSTGRDQGKCHAGYALVTFEDQELQTPCLNRLNSEIVIGSKKINASPSAKKDIQQPKQESFTPSEKKDLQTHSKNKMKNRRLRFEEEITRLLNNFQTLTSNHLVFDCALPLFDAIPKSISPPIDWDTVPEGVDPMKGGGLGSGGRGLRKRQQVETFFHVLFSVFVSYGAKELKPSRLSIVDFGCGSGNLTLPLASILEKHVPGRFQLTGVDMKSESIKRLNQKASESGLGEIVCGSVGRIEDFVGNLSVAISLHACGVATDLTVAHAIIANVPFIVSPCCIGKLKFGGEPEGKCSFCNADNSELINNVTWEEGVVGSSDVASFVSSRKLPRSSWMQKYLQNEDFVKIIRRADSDHSGTNKEFGSSDVGSNAQKCKTLVELDRALLAAEVGGYNVTIVKLIGHEDFAKNDLIIGVPRSWPSDSLWLKHPNSVL